jgi:arylsulfatase A-like enzyme
VRWPARIKPGKSTALFTQTDFMLSFADLLGVTIPEGAAPDSQNSLKALLGEDPEGNEYLVEEAVGYALRQGDWKLVMHPGKKNARETGLPPEFELYNLATDIGEQVNIAASHPEKVEQLKKILIRIQSGAGVRETLAAGG